MTTVLIVDDSPIDQKIAAAVLEAEGIDVRFADDGKQAIEQFGQLPADIVLTDLRMPVMDGLALVRELRQLSPRTPVIVVTGNGSEETAVEALQCGAASYVPKRNMANDLPRAMETVRASMASMREQDQIRSLLQHSESYYVLDYDPHAPQSLITSLQEDLAQAEVGNESDRLRVGTALAEALTNAIDHGNLELDSELRENDPVAYQAEWQSRAASAPFRNRRVHVTARIGRDHATFVVRDEGPGFDPASLPDPTDPENLTKAGGRGILLIQTFMDVVTFNETGNEITMVKHSKTDVSSCG